FLSFAAEVVSMGRLEREGRPPNVFTLEAARDPQQCETTLKALNQPLMPRQPWTRGFADLLISTYLDVDRIPIKYSIAVGNTQAFLNADLVVADFDNDGVDDNIVVSLDYLGGTEANRIFLLPKTLTLKEIQTSPLSGS